MKEEKNANNNNLKAISELKDFHFVVEKYQRGYKWNIDQIDELLFDINHFEEGVERFYCLQPVVVTEIDTNTYELIDGQQRLTTIFIILKILNIDIYTISYKTRTSSENFLKDITSLEKGDLPASNSIQEIKKQLNHKWEEYIKNRSSENNVDNYHFFRAFHYINYWLDKNEKDNFKEKLLNLTKVIWYLQLNEGGQKAETIFINFNQGKIELAQAELIKALFVLQLNNEKNIELRSFKLNQFADEWNSIENQLQDNLFWLFISNDISDNKKYNRIDLLFDIVKRKPPTSFSKLYSYHKYLDDYNHQKELNWEEVRDLFNQLSEWFSNRSYFHLIGFIIYQKIKNIAEITDKYKSITQKSKFSNSLKSIIREYLYEQDKKTEKYDLDTIDYRDSRAEIKTILVLFNILTYQKGDFNYRFPFDRLKLEEGWSIEHIHAQNTDNFEKIKDIRDWVTDIEGLKQYENKIFGKEINLQSLEELKSTINKYKDEDKLDSKIKYFVNQLDEELYAYFDKDKISNLCLLDGRTNSGLGKNYFKQKRDIIISKDKEILTDDKVFIPMATKNVFLKYYTKETKNIQMTYWGSADRNDYKEAIEDGIKEYLEI